MPRKHYESESAGVMFDLPDGRQIGASVSIHPDLDSPRSYTLEVTFKPADSASWDPVYERHFEVSEKSADQST